MGATEGARWPQEDGVEVEEGKWPSDEQQRRAQPKGEGGGLDGGGLGECLVPQVDGGLW